MKFTDEDYNSVGRMYIEKFNGDRLTAIVNNLLACDYQVIITTDEDTKDFIIQYSLEDSYMNPKFVKEDK